MGKKSSPRPEPISTAKLPAETKQFYREIKDYRPEVYTGDRLAPQSGQELGYIQGLENLAGAAQSPFYQAGEGVINQLLTPFEDSNYKNILDTAVKEAGSGIEQQYALSGRSGSPAFAKSFGAGVTRAGADVLRDYDRQRLNALGLGADITSRAFNEDQQRLGLLGKAAQLQSGYDQRLVDVGRQELDERNRAEQQRIANVSGLLGTGYQQDQLYTPQARPNRFAGALGGGLAAAGAGLGPIGIGAGALLGLLS